MPVKINRRSLCLCVLIAIVVPAGISLWYWNGQRPHRVRREHAGTVAKEFEYLTSRIDFDPPHRSPLSRRDAQEDLDELEWLLENRYSYLNRKGVNYKAALDSLRNSLADGIDRSCFGYQLSKFIALFGDGHSQVASSTVRLSSLCSSFPPFLVEESGGRFMAFKPDRSAFIDPNFPFLRAIDGVSMDTWLEAAGLTVAKGSPQFVRYNTIRNLRYIKGLRRELGLSKSRNIEVLLESADGLSSRQLILPLVEERPIYGFWPRPETEIKSMEDARVESRILEPNIGYLRFVMMLAEPEFLDDLIEAMDRRNFSACDIFLGVFKGLKNVTLMGQPSGGGSGCYQVYRLRNSKIRIHLSSMSSFQPNGQLYDGNGIRPDIIVESAPTDFIGETDILLDTAIKSLIH